MCLVEKSEELKNETYDFCIFSILIEEILFRRLNMFGVVCRGNVFKDDWTAFSILSQWHTMFVL